MKDKESAVHSFKGVLVCSAGKTDVKCRVCNDQRTGAEFIMT